MPISSISPARLFDVGLSALAAASAGFVAFAMPEPLFSGLVSATPLPDLVEAARPPLGETARLVAVGGLALFTFAFVSSLLAAIDRLPRRRPLPSAAVAVDDDAPRLRRADAHPDAPARRPLVAARDLGEPLELETPAPTVDLEAPPAPQPEAAPAPIAAAQIERPRPIRAPDPHPEDLSGLVAQLPDAAPQAGQTSIAQLLGRVESGLARKRQALPTHSDPIEVTLPEAPEPAAPEERVGHRLRNAISELQKISARG